MYTLSIKAPQKSNFGLEFASLAKMGSYNDILAPTNFASEEERAEFAKTLPIPTSNDKGKPITLGKSLSQKHDDDGVNRSSWHHYKDVSGTPMFTIPNCMMVYDITESLEKRIASSKDYVKKAGNESEKIKVTYKVKTSSREDQVTHKAISMVEKVGSFHEIEAVEVARQMILNSRVLILIK